MKTPKKKVKKERAWTQKEIIAYMETSKKFWGKIYRITKGMDVSKRNQLRKAILSYLDSRPVSL